MKTGIMNRKPKAKDFAEGSDHTHTLGKIGFKVSAYASVTCYILSCLLASALLLPSALVLLRRLAFSFQDLFQSC